MLSYLVGEAINTITLSGLQKILYLTHGDAAVARAVQDAIAQKWQPLSLAAPMRREVGFQQGIIAVLRGAGPDRIRQLVGETGPEAARPSRLSSMSSVRWQSFLDANGVYLLQLMPKAIAVADQPYPVAFPAAQSLSADVAQPKELTHLIALIAFPDMGKDVRIRAQVQARADVLRISAALLCYRAAHGTYPPTLESALSPVTRDPFDGKPLRYKHSGPNFVIYSVGPTGIFDGGTPFEKPVATETVFRYPLPPFYRAAE